MNQDSGGCVVHDWHQVDWNLNVILFILWGQKNISADGNNHSYDNTGVNHHQVVWGNMETIFQDCVAD